MNARFYIHLAVYEFFDVVPFVILVVAPFRNRMRHERMTGFFSLLLYFLGFARRCISYTYPASSAILSVLWTVLYLMLCYYVIREPLPKLLFVLITVLNYASMAAILYSYIGYHLFPGKIEQNPYCLENSLSIFLILAASCPFILYWFVYKLRPLMEDKVNDHVWTTLWFVPATFYVFFYYNIFSSENILAYSISSHNLIFSLVISMGSFFVLILVLRLVRMNALAALLEAEKKQLELHSLQYQRLSERFEEARRARHDLRQLLAVIQVYLENGDTENLRGYIETICSSFTLDSPMVICLHPALNALICYYSEIAAKRHISFSVQADCPENLGVQNTDLVVLFGNLLENAIEACTRQEDGKSFIRLNAQKMGGQLIVTLDNSLSGDCRTNGDSFYSSKRPGYGIGISTVRQIVKKYHGTVNFQVKEQIFCVSLILMTGEN